MGTTMRRKVIESEIWNYFEKLAIARLISLDKKNNNNNDDIFFKNSSPPPFFHKKRRKNSSKLEMAILYRYKNIDISLDIQTTFCRYYRISISLC